MSQETARIAESTNLSYLKLDPRRERFSNMNIHFQSCVALGKENAQRLPINFNKLAGDRSQIISSHLGEGEDSSHKRWSSSKRSEQRRLEVSATSKSMPIVSSSIMKTLRSEPKLKSRATPHQGGSHGERTTQIPIYSWRSLVWWASHMHIFYFR
ncbi:hypothetical protein PanWU01x14_136500 [Parasponia andersonii]|uniref:Uncharacterized protein n=1 Tax=Parasponia andersonii TaxID=3476 RepID=A0A2P5CNW7_PARAD|nr:hypothetical protein PanWU01x14_136500 [Parasponia andersonii]